MCPDRQILSVYLDRELPSPWKEKMENHLAGCPTCRARIEGYRQVSTRLASRNGEAGLPGEAVRERVWRSLNLAREEAAGSAVGLSRGHEPQGPRHIPDYAPGFWRRSVSIPLPAAAAAAAILFLVLGFAFNNRPAETAQDSTVAVGIEPGLQSIEPASDMAGILQYLGREDQGDIVIIRLPESRSFSSAGEPTIMKAADYSRRVTSP
ncbi:MAG: zf-HC2 domain-containing protein [Spirochaetaceae bacterium]|jgi:anti-sigma factor RsiW|nr:zf-HC2 domain-containing protein [Spirochaetaceae bacterium]